MSSRADAPSGDFIINRFPYSGIVLVTNGGNVIQGNYIGTDSTGTLARPNTNGGIYLIDSG